MNALRQEMDKMESLIAQYGNYIYTIVSRIAYRRATAEDIEECIADVLAALFHAHDHIRPDETKQYVAAVARNKAVDMVKKLSRTGDFLPLNEDVLEIGANDSTAEFERKEVEALLNEAIMTLPTPEPEIIIRRYYWGESLAQIAAAFGLTERAIEGRLYRGRKQLKAYLEGRLEE